jgi:tetratricopeptide (TPR) repeat protein
LRRHRAALAIALTTALHLACAGPPSAFATHFAAAERAVTAGRHRDAAVAFDAASRAEAPKREREHAAFLAALELVRSGDVAGGAARFEAIARARGEHAAQARWELVAMDVATRAANVTSELDDFIRTYPDSGLAYPALQTRLRLARDAGGESEVLALLRGFEPALAKTQSAPRIAYEIAESLAKLGKLDEASAAYGSVVDRWPYPGEYFDYALYRKSEVDETLGNLRDAVGDLERMLAVLESSTLPGTYVRPRFPDAGWRIAVLYRDKLGDKKRAIAAFERYVDRFPNDVRRAEALWQAAKLLSSSGDEDAACGRLAKLVSEAPDSRYVPCVTAKCTGVSRPKNSHAPERCHAYILREN